jgi:hypothetical protein
MMVAARNQLVANRNVAVAIGNQTVDCSRPKGLALAVNHFVATAPGCCADARRQSGSQTA